MNNEPREFGAGTFYSEDKMWGGRGRPRYVAPVLVVHSVAFPACVKYISRQGAI